MIIRRTTKEITIALEIVDFFIPVDVELLPLMGLDNFTVRTPFLLRTGVSTNYLSFEKLKQELSFRYLESVLKIV